MTLRKAVDRYVAWQRGHGAKFRSSSQTLNSFCRQIGEISLADKQVVSIENLYKHRDVFEPLTRDQLFVATPGTSNPDWKLLRFERLPRPIWPLDPDPLGLDAE